MDVLEHNGIQRCSKWYNGCARRPVRQARLVQHDQSARKVRQLQMPQTFTAEILVEDGFNINLILFLRHGHLLLKNLEDLHQRSAPHVAHALFCPKPQPGFLLNTLSRSDTDDH